MRLSKSMPDPNIRKFTKWGSINTDSGISLFSSDTMTIKHKDAISITSASTSTAGSSMLGKQQAQHQLDEVRRYILIFL